MSIPADTIRVLHVDDEPDLAEMAATFVERHNERFVSETASSADEGLDHLRDDEFDCIVSDYDMPGQNGIEFLESIRQEYPDLPFILYTGKGSEEIAGDAISAGVTDYLQKSSGTSQYTVLANRIQNAVDQYRSRQAVDETERKLSELAERSDDILYMFTGDWSDLLYLNSAFEEIWGIPVDQVQENPGVFIEYIHPEDRNDVRRSMERLSQGHPDELEYRVVRPDGDQRWVRGQSKPIFDEDGDVTRIVGFVRDITERKERQRRFEAIFNNTYTFVGLLEPDGTLIEANETALSFGGLGRDDIIGTKLWEAFWFQHSEATRERAQRAVERAADGEFVRHELPVQGADSEAIIDFSIRPVTDEQGNVTLLVPEGRDITARTERENRLRGLNERTSHLVAASTSEQLCELGVDAASEVLGFDANAIHLYDDDQAGLAPFAGTDRIHDLVGELPVFSEGESIAWRVYENGETLAVDDVRDDPDTYNPDTPIKSELFLPLGDHGILIAGSETPAEFDRQDITFGEILADTITTVLDRLTREQALKRSEARYRALTDDVLDTSDVGTFILDADFDVVWINEATEKYFGIDREAVVGADKRQLVHDHVRHIVEDSDGFARTVLATYEDNTYAEEFDCHVLPADEREERWLKHWSQPIESGLYEGGRIEHYTDITERRRREMALRRNERRFESMLQDPNILVGLLDTDGVVQHVNDTALEYVDADRQAIVGDPFWGTPWWDADATADLQRWIDRAADGEYVEYEVDHPTADGDVFSVEGTIRPVKNDEGSVVSLIVSARDITEQKHREAELEKVRDQMEFALARTGSVIWERDPETGEIDSYPDPSPPLDGSLETVEEFENRVYEEDRSDVLEAVESVIETGESETVEYRTIPEVDAEWVEAQIQPVYDDDSVSRLIGISRDITDLKRRQQQLETQNERFDELASVISHDLQTPMQTIEGRLEMAVQTGDTTHIEDALDAVDRLDELREDMVTMLRTREIVGETAELDIAELAESAWEAVNSSDGSTLELGEIPRMEGDPAATRRLLQNLLSNAVEHAECPTSVQIGAVPTGFYVEDDGPGIDPEDREAVFIPGFSTKSDEGGMGMASVRQIVTEHGWDIDIEDADTLDGVRVEITGIEVAAE